MKGTKVPKQFKHWTRLAGLKPTCSKHHRQHVLYYTGYGRRWRVNQLGNFDMSDTDFDRWANSLETYVKLPTTKDQFLESVEMMKNGQHNK